MSQASQRLPINWPAALVLLGTPLAALIVIPWYAWSHGFGVAAWVSFFVLLWANGLAITAGYHRLWAHRAYEAHWSVRLVLALFGAMAVQNSILVWASGHRTHHKHVDDNDADPYSARRGFWFSHMGWMLRHYPSGKADFSNARDLQNDPIVMFQHRHYVPIALAMNLGVPLLWGVMVGDVAGVFLLGGLLRLVVSHHVTFFINSLAHIWGSQPYTEENTARDNPWLALVTYGEGYHNYHHIFQYDYRNGVKWWQFDPTKWLICALSWVGLARNLKRCPAVVIRKAQLAMQFQRAERQLAEQHLHHRDLDTLRGLIAEEYEAFTQAIQEWSRLREAWYAEKKREITGKWQEVNFRTRFREIEYRLKMQSKRLQWIILQAQPA